MDVLYKIYLVLLAYLGSLIPKIPGIRLCLREGECDVNAPADDFESVDKLATKLGNRYRGMGVLVGIMGVGIIFCAIGPFALQLDSHVEGVLGGLKIVLLVSMLLLVWAGTCSRVKDRWITARREAEMLRYADLHQSIQHLLRQPHDLKEQEAVRSKLLKILDGPKGQVAYNACKAKQYESIEHFSNLAGWLGFIFALTAAIAHIWIHEPWLLMFTGFLPALIGGIHGINGFLGLAALAEENSKMNDRLGQLLDAVKHPDPDENFLKLAKLTYDTLTTRDVMWAGDAVKLGLRPA